MENAKFTVFFDKLELFGGSRDAREYAYAGGTGDNAALKKFQHTGLVAPLFTKVCMCGHSIKMQCYIQVRGKRELGLAVVGSCCIKRFIPNGTNMTCEKCQAPHKNRKNNLCNMCRIDAQIQLENERIKEEQERRIQIEIQLEIEAKKERENQVYIRVPFANKDWAKDRGAYWDPAERMWYCSKENEAIMALYRPIRPRFEAE